MEGKDGSERGPQSIRRKTYQRRGSAPPRQEATSPASHPAPGVTTPTETPHCQDQRAIGPPRELTCHINF